ncbi:MAG: sigma-70 family RNA polymerase sigma factor [Actinomycetota bacterium]
MGARPHGGTRGGLDPAGFEALVAAEAPGLYRFALTLTRDPATAEDLVQDTFVRAYENRDGFAGRSSPATWLHRILHNVAVDHLRRHRNEIPAEEVEALWRDDAYVVDAAAVTEAAETRQELEDALVRLPFIYRAVLVLHDIEGWTVAQIAERLGIGLPAAKQRLRRGRMMLVSALDAGAERRGALPRVPLRCWDARHMVSEYMNDDLAPEERAAVERHLRDCPTCPPLYAALVGTRARLGTLRDPDSVIPPDLARRIAARHARG